jgi:hypothetical protein
LKKEKGKRRIYTTIGTDPEFVLMDVRGRHVRADQYPFFECKHSTAKIGSDGAGTPVEIRPNATPINDLKPMIDDINDIFIRIARWCKKKGLRLNGGARQDGVSIGSHIHFGGTDFLTPSQSPLHGYSQLQNFTDFYVRDNINKLTMSLDTYLTPITNFFLSTDEIMARRKGGYGKLGEYRGQKWGIEYRTPYCFLLSPLLTIGIYSLACLIGNNFKRVFPNKNLYLEVVKYYDQMDSYDGRKIHKNIYKKIKPKILDMLTYNSPNPQYNSYILSLFNLIEQNKTCKTVDVLTNYKLDDVKTVPFTVNWGRGQDIRRVRSLVEGGIKNTTYGEIFIYYHETSYEDRRIVCLSQGLPTPKMHYLERSDFIIKYSDEERKSGYKYHLGLSRQILHDIIRTSSRGIWLSKYISNLKLRIDDNV